MTPSTVPIPAQDVPGTGQGRDPQVPRPAGAPLRRVLGLRLALAAALPLLILVVVLQLLHNRSLEREFQDELRQLAQSTAVQVDLYLEQHLAVIATLGQLADGLDPADPADGPALQRLLDGGRAEHPGFLSLLVAAPDGALAAAALPRGTIPTITLGRPGAVSDRGYFQVPLRENRRYVSEVFRGRSFGSDLIVALSAPLHDAQGQPHGVIEGSLDLGRLRRFDPLPEHGDLALAVLDAQARVVYASAGAGLPALHSLAASPLLQRLLQEAPGVPLRHRPKPDDPGPSCLAVRWPLQHGWQMVVRRHTGTLSTLERQAMGLTLGLLVAALALTALITDRVSARVTVPVQRLARAVADFERGSDPAPAPASAPREVQELFLGYAALSERLHFTLGTQRAALAESDRLRERLQHSLAEREQLIEQRTRALQIANAELAIVNGELERLTGEDALTGVANRRAFEDFLAGSWRLAAREGESLALVLLDVDHFKAFNDRHGHPAGDDCLRRLARTGAQVLCGPADLFARYGGEEFIAVLRQTTLAEALQRAEALQAAIHALALAHGAPGAGALVTVSIGVAAAQPVEDAGREQLLQRADAALYRAKREGRDRIGADAGEAARLSGSSP